ncbi:MAG: hypothetical protein WCL14_11305 [Bacteroidota bacterium]
MTYRKVCLVEDNKVIINLPDDFKGMKQVVVVVDDMTDTMLQKLELMKKAAKDNLFLEDIREIQDDFDSIDRDIQ